MQRRNKSKLRDRILQIIAETKAHPTADWIYLEIKKEFPRTSLGTVYRNLTILAEQGRIQKLSCGSTFDRFEADLSPHYHLICRKCGRIEDFTMPGYEQINKLARDQTSFEIASHRIDFFGLCKHCKTKQPRREEHS